MKQLPCALAALCFANALILPAATRIDDPKAFVTEVYRRLMAPAAADTMYVPPDDIYSPRLEKLIRDDRRKAKGEVGCVDFLFWVNGQDYEITKLTITSVDQGQDAKTVIAKFLSFKDPEEIHFDFRRIGGRWLLDDAHSVTNQKWTLSDLYKCTY